MPATLSAIPVAGAVAAVAGAAGIRPAQAAHVVVPSAICAPHMLQKAIRISSDIVGQDAEQTLRFRSRAAFAARYQKNSGKAIANLTKKGLCHARILFGQIADQWKRKSLALKSFDQENDPREHCG